MIIFLLIFILLPLHAAVPYWTRYLSKKTNLSRAKATLASTPPIFLLISIYASVILSSPFLLLAVIFSNGGAGISNDLGFTLSHCIRIWASTTIIFGLPIFGLSYLFAMIPVNLFYDHAHEEEVKEAKMFEKASRKPSACVDSAIRKRDIGTLVLVAENFNSNPEILKKIYNHCNDKIEGSPASPYWSVIYRIANNRSTPLDVLEELAQTKNNPAVLKALKNNPVAITVNSN